MARKPELWTTYAKRRFEQAGLRFQGWYDTNSGDDKISFLNRGGNGESRGLERVTFILQRIYSSAAFDELMTNPRPNQYQLFLDEKITEFFSFNADNGYINFVINPFWKVVVEDRSPDLNKRYPGRLFPRKKEAQRNAADFLDQLGEYTESILSSSNKI